MNRFLKLLTTHIRGHGNPETVDVIRQAQINLFDLKPVWLSSGIKYSILQ
jgi:hypothetical protein